MAILVRGMLKNRMGSIGGFLYVPNCHDNRAKQYNLNVACSCCHWKSIGTRVQVKQF